MFERLGCAVRERREEETEQGLHYLDHEVKMALEFEPVVCEHGLKEAAEMEVYCSRA